MTKRKLSFSMKLYLIGALSILSACSAAKVDEEPKLAVLLESSSTNTQIISQAMSTVLNGTKVSLESHAFLKTSQHILQKRSFTTPNAADGLMLGTPQINRFTLYSKGSTCYLVYINNNKNYPLQNLKCKPL